MIQINWRDRFGFIAIASCPFLMQGCLNAIQPTSNQVNPDSAELSLGLSINAPNTQNFYRLTKLHRGYLPVPGGNEFANFPVEAPISGYIDQGLSWYVFDNNESKANGATLHELFGVNSGCGNFMPSKHVNPNEGGYSHAWALGKVESGSTLTVNNIASNFSLSPMYRYYREWDINPSQAGMQYYIDHMLGFDGENPAGAGYTQESIAQGYSFPRFNYDVQHIQANHPPFVTVASTSQVQVGIIPSWGAVIGSIIVDNVEYVNVSEPGTCLQMATRAPDFGDAYNPTEAGDVDRNGSPATYQTNSSTFFSANTIPLMWLGPNRDANHPYLYGGEFGKGVEIMPAINGAQVIRYAGRFMPFETRSDWIIEMPAFHLNLAGIYGSNGTAAGWNTLYTVQGNSSLVQRSTYSRQISTMARGTIDWRELRLNGTTGSPGDNNGHIPAGTHILLMAHNINMDSTAVGVLMKNSPYPANAMTIWNRDRADGPAETDYGPHYLNTNHLNLMLRSVSSLSAGDSFLQRVYLLFGTRASVYNAANSIISNPSY